MKRGVFIVLLAGVLALGGCQTKKEAEEARITEAFENMGVEHEEVIKAVLSKKWNAVEPDDIYQTTGDTYEFTREGTGEFSGESFTYTCGFDDEHEIVLRIVMDDTKEEKTYFVRTDDTGYGLLAGWGRRGRRPSPSGKYDPFGNDRCARGRHSGRMGG